MTEHEKLPSSKAPHPDTPIGAFGKPVGSVGVPTRNVHPAEVQHVRAVQNHVDDMFDAIPLGRARSIAATKWDECRMWLFEAFRQDV